MIPQIKPFTEAITALEVAVLAVLALFALSWVGLYSFGEYRRVKRRWAAFKTAAQKRGLNSKQADLLAAVARTQHLKEPLALLRSLHAFDRHVGGYAAALADRGLEQGAKTLASITQVRQVLGFDQLKAHQLMRTTRQLSVGQNLVLWPSGHTLKNGVTCTLVARDDGALTVVPVVKSDEMRAESWAKGLPLEGRLNGGDRGVFSFSTAIYQRNEAGIILRHCHQLKRCGGRDFLRWDACFQVGFFAVPRPLWAEREEGLDLLEMPYFEALATNVSGGGMCAHFEEQVPRGIVLVVDPDFVGPFPLAGIACQAVTQGANHAGDEPLNLKFVDLTGGQENQIVRAINRCQLEAHVEAAPEPS